MELFKKLVEVAAGDMVTGHGGGGLGLILGIWKSYPMFVIL